MANAYEEGRVNMIVIEFFNRALKATWVAKYFDDTNKENGDLF